MDIDHAERVTRRVSRLGAIAFGAAVLLTGLTPIFYSSVDSDHICAPVAVYELGFDVTGGACTAERFDDRFQWTSRFLFGYAVAITVWAVTPTVADARRREWPDRTST